MIREKQFLSPLFSVPANIAKGEFTRAFSGDRARCHYCGRATFYKTHQQAVAQPFLTRTVDHKVPKARGGMDNQCLVSCRRCNHVKGDSPYETFRAWCTVNDPWGPRAERLYREFLYDCAHAGLKAGTDLAKWIAAQDEKARRIDPVMAAFHQFRQSRRAA